MVLGWGINRGRNGGDRLLGHFSLSILIDPVLPVLKPPEILFLISLSVIKFDMWHKIVNRITTACRKKNSKWNFCSDFLIHEGMN